MGEHFSLTIGRIQVRLHGLLVVIVAGAALGFGVVPAAAERPAPDRAAGQAAYELQCARCHGVTGKGDGRDAKRLYPRPRDLTSGVFKFRSTASGTVPTDDDLFNTLDHGLTAGNMPDWSHLDEPTRWQIIEYIKSFSQNFTTNPPQLVDLGTDPGRQADLTKGKQVYEKLGCAACHGASGRANGTSAQGLTDDWGMAIRPANLTQGWNYRGGSEPKQIVTRIIAGIDGAQMPSYIEASTPEDVWQLAHYVRSLQEEPRWSPSLKARRMQGDLPAMPEDPRWHDVERATVRLRNTVDATGTMAHPPTINAVTVQALYNEDTIHFRVQWDDPTQDRGEAGDVLMLALRPAGLRGDVVTLQTWPTDDAPALDLLVWSANRQPEGQSAGQAYEALVDRYEPVLQGEPRGMPWPVHIAYDAGRWTAVFGRPLKPEGLDHRAAQFVEERFNPVGFVIWDGGNHRQRAVSEWLDVELAGASKAHGQPHTASSEANHASGTGRPIPWPWIVSGVVMLGALALALKRR